MSIAIITVKQFYSQGYQRVYDEGQPLEIPSINWSFHIHGLGVEPADALDAATIYPYLRTLRFAFDLELIWHTPEPGDAEYTTHFGDYLVANKMPDCMLSDVRRVPERITIEDDLEYKIPEDIQIDPTPFQVELPGSIWESYRFYSKNITEKDWGKVYGLRITIEGQDTLIIRTTTDGSDGWLEVFDREGNYLAAARTSGDGIAWRSQDQVRSYVFGTPKFPPELM